MRRFLLLGNVVLLLAAMLPGAAFGSPADPAVAGIAARLGGTDPAARRAAADDLRRLGQAPLSTLLDRLGNGAPAERRGSAIGLALLPMPGYAADGLLAALADPEPAVRGLAAHALAVIGSPAARSAAALLASPDEPVRTGAAYALMLMKEQAVPALAALLSTPDPTLRAKAAWLLGRLGPLALPAAPALIRSLDCPDIRAMHVIAEAIDLIGPDPAVILFHALQIGQHGNHPVGRNGLDALPTLVRLLTRPGTLTGRAAFRAIAVLGAAAAPDLERAVAAGTPGQRIAAALLLVDIDPDYVTRLPDDVRDALAGAGRE